MIETPGSLSEAAVRNLLKLINDPQLPITGVELHLTVLENKTHPRPEFRLLLKYKDTQIAEKVCGRLHSPEINFFVKMTQDRYKDANPNTL